MSTRFRVDLLHPGDDLRQIGWVAKSWEEWFVGSGAGRRLGLFSGACLLVVAVILVLAILIPSWQLSSGATAVPGLQRDLAVRQSDLDLLRANLGALSEEARRQVRWSELLAAISRAIPAALKLQIVEATRGPASAAPGQAPGAPAPSENVLRIEALTPVRPGSPPLLEVAQFMAGLMRDPAVNKRFRLRSWDIKAGTGSLLNISIVLAERA